MREDMYDFNIVTTFDKKHTWGHDMVESCDKHLPSNCLITVYIEEKMENRERIIYRPLDTNIIESFNLRFSPIRDRVLSPRAKAEGDRGYNYRFDAGRFCYKMFAMELSARFPKSRYLVWVDADVLFNSSPDEQWFHDLIEEGCYTSYLHRVPVYGHSETGFIVFDTHHSYHSIWWDTVAKIYNECLFPSLPIKGWTDSHIHDYMIALSEKDGVKHKRLSDNAGHAWNESPLIEHCRHYKGIRKEGEHGSNK